MAMGVKPSGRLFTVAELRAQRVELLDDLQRSVSREHWTTCGDIARDLYALDTLLDNLAAVARELDGPPQSIQGVTDDR